MIRNKELRTLKYAEAKLENFLAASKGEPSTCASFNAGSNFGMEPFSEEQKRAIRIYLETWVQEPLICAIKAIEGDRSFVNETDLEMWSRP
jgi:hypothetical protein